MPWNLTNFDRNIRELAFLNLGGYQVKFQFPPLIKSDGKSMEFDEKELKNIEPLAIFKGSKPRVISLDWTYIVTDHQPLSGVARTDGRDQGGKEWTASAISRIVKSIRRYYYVNAIDEQPFLDNIQTVVIRGGFYDQAGTSSGDRNFTFRSERVDVKHGDVLVREYLEAPGSKSRKVCVYPLRTDISMNLKLWTNSEVDKKEMVKINGLRPAGDIGMKVKDDTTGLHVDWF